MKQATAILVALALVAVSGAGSVAAPALMGAGNGGSPGDSADVAERDTFPIVWGVYDPPWPFSYEFETVSYNQATGEVTIRLTIRHEPDSYWKAGCDVFTVTLYPVRGLDYSGPETLLIDYRAEPTYAATLHAVAPPNDTSCLVALWECGGMGHWFGHCFVTTGDTLETRPAHSGNWRNLALKRSDRLHTKRDESFIRAQREWEEKQTQRQAHPYGRSVIMSGDRHYLILDLREPEDYEFARKLLDSLVATDQSGFYRALVKKEILQKLEGQGIKSRPAVRVRSFPADSVPDSLLPLPARHP